MINQLTDVRPWLLSRRVLPQHTDHAGVMWHGSYLSWLEEARVEALAMVGLPYSQLSTQGFEMPVVSLEIKYLRAALHGDELMLKSWCSPRNRLRWRWHSIFLKESHIHIAEAKVDLVLIEKVAGKHRLIRNIPKSIDRALENLQKGPLFNNL